MTKHTYIEEKLKEFDEKFGIDNEDDTASETGFAGCDDCNSNRATRKEHKSFLKSSLEEAWEKGMWDQHAQEMELKEREYPTN